MTSSMSWLSSELRDSSSSEEVSSSLIFGAISDGLHPFVPHDITVEMVNEIEYDRYAVIAEAWFGRRYRIAFKSYIDRSRLTSDYWAEYERVADEMFLA